MLKLCTSNKGLVWFTSSKIKICPTQNQMEPEANAFERCFALIRVLDIFQLPEVIFLEAANHQSNQVGRFICLLLCQCTSVNCPLSKGCWSGNYRWSIYFAQYCCLTLWKYVNDTGEIHITHQHQRVSKQNIPIIIPILKRRPFIFLLWIGFYLNWYCSHVNILMQYITFEEYFTLLRDDNGKSFEQALNFIVHSLNW